MMYYETKGDIFDLDQKYFIAHTVSSDLALGMGFAPKVRTHFQQEYGYDMQEELNKFRDKMNPTIFDYENIDLIPLDACIIPAGRYLQVVSKRYYFDKPTYEMLHRVLWKLSRYCIDNDIKYLAMPLIGCGLDRLDWNRVSYMIQQLFSDINIEIVVVHYNNPKPKQKKGKFLKHERSDSDA